MTPKIKMHLVEEIRLSPEKPVSLESDPGLLGALVLLGKIPADIPDSHHGGVLVEINKEVLRRLKDLLKDGSEISALHLAQIEALMSRRGKERLSFLVHTGPKP